MALKHTLLSKIYKPLQISNKLLRKTGILTKGRLRIANYHDVAECEQMDFEKQLRWLSQNWTFISPSKFKSIMCGEESLQGSNLLLTFDDGFISNKKIADEVLNPMGIHALFFIVPAFADLTNQDDARKFIAQYIYPDIKVENIKYDNLTLGDYIFTVNDEICIIIERKTIKFNTEIKRS